MDIKKYDMEINQILDELETLQGQHIYELDPTPGTPRASTCAKRAEEKFKELLLKIQTDSQSDSERMAEAFKTL